MRVNLFGLGMRGQSPAVTAAQRINCYGEIQKDPDRTKYALYGTPGMTLFADLGSNPSRGLWAVDSLATPTLYSVNAGTLYSINAAGAATAITNNISTSTGDVSMVDDGTNLLLVDGSKAYYAVMTSSSPSVINITSGTLPTNPKYCTWQDQYFVLVDGASRQFNLSDVGQVSSWPATGIAFAASQQGNLQACIADHGVLSIFADHYAEFWQNSGGADFPYSYIPGSTQDFGLTSPWSLARYDNSVAGLFRNEMGESIVAKLYGFRLDRMSDFELEWIINNEYTTISDAEGYGFMLGGHPMYQLSFPTEGKTWLYDGASKEWSVRQSTDGTRHWSQKFAVFRGKRLVSDYRNGKIYEIDPTVYTDNGSEVPMEVISKHLWDDDRHIAIPRIQVDFEQGVGVAVGQGSDPQVMLSVSKDGGNSFSSEKWRSLGAGGEYTKRALWNRLGRARDWVFKLRVTDPVKRVITGASAVVNKGTS